VTSRVSVLAAYLERYVASEPLPPARRPYQHMGATICDAILQAGLNYRSVVAPRVNRLMRLWPLATTTSAFLAKADRYGLNQVLNWQDPVKPARMNKLGCFMVSSGIETENCLRAYLADDQRAQALRTVPGIGPKTFDYLKILAGMPALAVDRHMRAVLDRAGVGYTGYADAHKLMLAAAELLGMEPGVLDVRIWAVASRR
jgi:hypothetical protein